MTAAEMPAGRFSTGRSWSWLALPRRYPARGVRAATADGPYLGGHFHGFTSLIHSHV
jgi:hypothetical protein